jgi:hypothetical protein
LKFFGAVNPHDVQDEVCGEQKGAILADDRMREGLGHLKGTGWEEEEVDPSGRLDDDVEEKSS